MNLAAYLSGVIKALGRDMDWAKYFNVSETGFRQSFLALILSVPCYYICALAIQSERARIAAEPATYPNAVFFVVLGLYALMFVVCAYIISIVFDRMEQFKPWVIVRHWAVFFASLLAAFIFGLNILGVLPFQVANYLVLFIYLGTLAIDIRLAYRIPNFQWGPAVFVGCIITGMSLTALLIGVAQFA